MHPFFAMQPSSGPESLRIRELCRGTVNVYPYPLPTDPPPSYSQTASALAIQLDTERMKETWVLFSTYHAPKLQESGAGTAMVVKAVAPAACAPLLSAWTGDAMPSEDEFKAAMKALAKTRGLSFTILEVVTTRTV